MEKKVNELNNRKVPAKYQILSIPNMGIEVKSQLINKQEILDNIDETCSEYFKLKEWMDNLMKVPFNKCVDLPVKLQKVI